MIDPKKLENWTIVENDNALFKAIQKQNKWSRTNFSNVLDYQKTHIVTAMNFCKKFDMAIDAGANYGLMSYHLSKKFLQVHAFEIDDAVRDCLKKNIDKFEMTNVQIYDCGLGNSDESVDLIYQKNSFATRIDPNRKQGRFSVRSIDSFEFCSCDLIKIDCEGYEPFIILGATQTIKNYKPVILMEDKNLSADYGTDGQESVKILESWGYKKSHSFRKDCIMTYQGKR
jgi:FkbM family methyltransferase